MDGLFDGLEKFGMKGISKDINIYEEEESNKAKGPEEKEEKEKPVISEETFIFDKSVTCPVCGKTFKYKTVRAGKAKFLGSDSDLRPLYEGIDVVKYDSILCTHCGYASLAKGFNEVTARQSKEIKEKICADFKGMEYDAGAYSYKNAIDRMKLVLLNNVVRHAKLSERAFVCLKLSWLYRGVREKLDKNTPDYEAACKKLQDEENAFLKNAYDGFFMAVQKEMPPICGMDDLTVNYLLAELGRKCKDYDNAARFAGYILESRAASSKVKEKARTVREQIRQERESMA